MSANIVDAMSRDIAVCLQSFMFCTQSVDCCTKKYRPDNCVNYIKLKVILSDFFSQPFSLYASIYWHLIVRGTPVRQKLSWGTPLGQNVITSELNCLPLQKLCIIVHMFLLLPNY